MSKEAEILRNCISFHDKHMCQKSRKPEGRVSQVRQSFQKVILKAGKCLAVYIYATLSKSTIFNHPVEGQFLII